MYSEAEFEIENAKFPKQKNTNNFAFVVCLFHSRILLIFYVQAKKKKKKRKDNRQH